MIFADDVYQCLGSRFKLIIMWNSTFFMHEICLNVKYADAANR